MALRKQNNFSLVNIYSVLDVSIEDDLINQIESQYLFDSILLLPIGYRTVLNMYLIEGYNHFEIGKALGATVIAAASTDEKLDICRQHGADICINYSTEDLRAAIKNATSGKGPDVIYDPVGGIYAEAAFRSIAWRGRYLVVGFANGDIPKLPFNLMLLKGASVVGVFWGEFAKREPKANLLAMRELITWLAEGKIRPHISGRYALKDTATALNDLAARKVTGKIVIHPEQ